MKKSLKEFLKTRADEAEMKSHRETPDNKYQVRASAFERINIKLGWITALLDDIYEIEEKNDEFLLVKKKK